MISGFGQFIGLPKMYLFGELAYRTIYLDHRKVLHLRLFFGTM